MSLPLSHIALLLCLTSTGDVHGKFDTSEVHVAYLEGEFDLALDLLTSGPKPATRGDSIVFFRYLGAMCLKDEATYEQAAVYLRRMLALDPEEDMAGMYLSTKALLAFNVIKNEKLGPQAMGTADPAALDVMLDSLLAIRQKRKDDSLRTAQETRRQEEKKLREDAEERARREAEYRRKTELVEPSASRYWALPAGLLAVSGLGLLLIAALSL